MRSRRCVHRAGAFLFAVCAVLAPAQAARPAEPGAATTDSIAVSHARMRTVVAGDRYRAGTFHRFLLGNDYRHLWAAPIEIPELDLHAFAGGLRPVRRVGGQQTLGLAMKGADGRDYTFRGLDKDPTEILPPEYHGTFIDRTLQDQIASSLPGGAVAVSPLLRAAGVLHSEPIIVVMPDDSLLGEFQKLFAGLPGTFEEYPRAAGDGNPGSFGATELINGEELWKRMDADPTVRPDSRAFLTARLVDLLIGDWDRHRGQWHWANIPGHDKWQPIPEDRDQAFVRIDGLIPTAGRARVPQFVSFKENYPGIEGLTWNGRDGDRRILVDLEKPVWDEVARDVQTRITDAVIADAVARLPEGYRKLEGATLEKNLRHRRDELPVVADRFYHFLAHKVDVRCTDEADLAMVDHRNNGDCEVAVSSAGAPAAPYFHRVFHPGETDEVRIYLGGGADSVVTTGEPGKVTVRVIGGDGDDTVDDRAGTHLHVSDASGDNHVLAGSGTKLDTRPYTPPQREKAEWIPPRDWGRRTLFYPWIGGNSDLGVLFLAGLESHGYGFRKDPYADDQSLRVAYATRAGSFGADYTGEFHRENTGTYLRLYALASGLDFLHFYGAGNETKAADDEDFYKVKHTEYIFQPSLKYPMGRGWTASVHVSAEYSKTDLGTNEFITTAAPYGAEDFFQTGAGAGISLDTRNSDKTPTTGVALNADGTVFPEVGAVKSTFGEVHGDVALYQPIPVLSTPVLALRAGGKHVWGDFPYHEAAYIGGGGTLRGFPRQRFAGDASLFGNAELRIPIRSVYIFVPGSLGIYGLCDTGRVFLDGESSTKWHTAAGGGVWFAFLNQANTVSVSVASGDEGTRVYIHSGFAF
jgi:hypothetical protein